MTDNPEKIVLMGGRGMLGTDFEKAALNAGFDVKVYDLPEFDITDFSQLSEAVGQSNIIVNCAAYTNVDGAESNADLAYKVNAEAVGRLGQLARSNDSYVVHISTDFVFDGQKDTPYIETDPPNPLSVYGSTKYKGEELLAESGCRHCIIRVQWTYGAAGNNFVTKIIELGKTRDELKIIDDQIGSPTATTAISSAICKLLCLKELPQGLFHFAAAGFVNRFDQARFIFENLGIDVKLSPCKASDYVTAAKRPLNSRFNCQKIQKLLTEPITDWQLQLKDFLEQK